MSTVVGSLRYSLPIREVSSTIRETGVYGWLREPTFHLGIAVLYYVGNTL